MNYSTHITIQSERNIQSTAQKWHYHRLPNTIEYLNSPLKAYDNQLAHYYANNKFA